MKYSKVLLSIPVVCMALFYLGCSSSTSPTTDPNSVELYSQMESGSVTPMMIKKGDVNYPMSPGLLADSLHIDRIRILVRDVKLHGDKDDLGYPGHDVKVGPFLITIKAGSATLTAAAHIPDGAFDHMKMEIHRFSNSEVSAFINDTTYGDFVTGDRYSIIVDGHVFENGVDHPFRYNSEVTLNLTMKFDSLINISSKTSTKLMLLIDPSVLFRNAIFVSDPRDPNNRPLIENNIRLCFRALKRFL